MTNLVKHHKTREYADMKKPWDDKRFANSCFKSGRLYCKEFENKHSDMTNCMQLSHDESFFVTGGRYQDINENVLKHSMGGLLFGIQTELKPMVIHNESYFYIGEDHAVIMCVTISPDDRRIFSCGLRDRILIHDIQRYSDYNLPALI